MQPVPDRSPSTRVSLFFAAIVIVALVLVIRFCAVTGSHGG